MTYDVIVVLNGWYPQFLTSNLEAHTVLYQYSKNKKILCVGKAW